MTTNHLCAAGAAAGLVHEQSEVLLSPFIRLGLSSKLLVASLTFATILEPSEHHRPQVCIDFTIENQDGKP